MKLLTFLQRKINGFRWKQNSFLCLTLIVFVTCVGIGGLKPQPLQAQYTPTTAPSNNPWRYASFPVENFQTYTSPYGYRIHPVTGTRQFHYGLDMAAPLGSYVRSWWSGKIVELSDDTACGTTIKIQSGEWTHIYCHLMGHVESTAQGRFLVDREGGIVLSVGQNIPISARIARVGMTGRTTGPHLHWGLKYSGQYVDPGLILQQMYGQKTASR